MSTVRLGNIFIQLFIITSRKNISREFTNVFRKHCFQLRHNWQCLKNTRDKVRNICKVALIMWHYLLFHSLPVKSMKCDTVSILRNYSFKSHKKLSKFERGFYSIRFYITYKFFCEDKVLWKKWLLKFS